jgi:hypothetical protein
MNDAEIHAMLVEAKGDLNDFEFTAPDGYEHVDDVAEPNQVTAHLLHEECSICNNALEDLPRACSNCGSRCHVK